MNAPPFLNDDFNDFLVGAPAIASLPASALSGFSRVSGRGYCRFAWAVRVVSSLCPACSEMVFALPRLRETVVVTLLSMTYA